MTSAQAVHQDPALATESQEETSEVLELSRRLLPASGNDWGTVAHKSTTQQTWLADVVPLIHPDFEAVFPATGENTRVKFGLEATLAGLRQIGRSFDTLVTIPDLYVELGDSVLVLLHRAGRSSHGHVFNLDGAVLHEFADGLLRSITLYVDRASALAANGLTAEDAQRLGVPPID